ncbi:G2/mitotic-specific cyclin-B3 [Orchesella cincta]|uniref:G2/mitotic-specific cyclin-B3 n=1 Tax=Orchesella cincta TaxID=48709 RepID=A0A1D2MYZ9_ORCCI|nr:G2/mitotic-specific cyclin-B3 [Orchesella cincta]
MNRAREATKLRIGGLGGNKRKADISPKKEKDAKKRSALGDLTNAAKKKAAGLGGKDVVAKENKDKVEKPSLIPTIQVQELPRVTRARSKSLKENEGPAKRMDPVPEASKPFAVAEQSNRVLREFGQVTNAEAIGKLTRRSKSITKPVVKQYPDRKKPVSKQENSASSSNSINEEDSLMYHTAYSTPVVESEISSDDSVSTEEIQNRKNELLTEKAKSRLPDGVADFDEEAGDDPFQVGLYATDIFAYYKRREVRFPVKKYLEKQVELNKNMRSILVDWMVEVQESFEMNHETLYLAVKLVDLFLGRTLVKRDKLQLVGTTALYIAAKYDERCPPVIDDFCYICDDAYSQKDVIQMEEKLLKTLKFDIGMPLSYRFLRRYARVAKLDMETLTLARFILEMSLMDYDFIDGLDSMMAASALLLALKILKVENPWTPTLKYYSTYSTEDLFDLTHRLYDFLRKPQAHLKTIRSKYSHKVFYEVAKIPMPDELKL